MDKRWNPLYSPVQPISILHWIHMDEPLSSSKGSWCRKSPWCRTRYKCSARTQITHTLNHVLFTLLHEGSVHSDQTDLCKKRKLTHSVLKYDINKMFMFNTKQILNIQDTQLNLYLLYIELKMTSQRWECDLQMAPCGRATRTSAWCNSCHQENSS